MAVSREQACPHPHAQNPNSFPLLFPTLPPLQPFPRPFIPNSLSLPNDAGYHREAAWPPPADHSLKPCSGSREFRASGSCLLYPRKGLTTAVLAWSSPPPPSIYPIRARRRRRISGRPLPTAVPSSFLLWSLGLLVSGSLVFGL